MSKDWAVGLEVTACDATMSKLWTWLALHEPQMCKLIAEGDAVEVHCGTDAVVQGRTILTAQPGSFSGGSVTMEAGHPRRILDSSEN